MTEAGNLQKRRDRVPVCVALALGPPCLQFAGRIVDRDLPGQVRYGSRFSGGAAA